MSPECRNITNRKQLKEPFRAPEQTFYQSAARSARLQAHSALQQPGDIAVRHNEKDRASEVETCDVK
jgi:hypothetical protein